MIAAIVLAAGLSQRMGRPKMVLPWGKKTVIEQVVATLTEGGIEKIVVVTGGAHVEVEAVLEYREVEFVFNPDYANGEMLRSLQVGIAHLDPSFDAVLIVLGDQPQMEPAIVHRICNAYLEQGAGIIIPSYQMHRGHPWLIGQRYWGELLSLPARVTLRDFLNKYEKEISYQVVETPTVLKDLDTPEDYQREKPQ